MADPLLHGKVRRLNNNKPGRRIAHETHHCDRGGSPRPLGRLRLQGVPQLCALRADIHLHPEFRRPRPAGGCWPRSGTGSRDYRHPVRASHRLRFRLALHRRGHTAGALCRCRQSRVDHDRLRGPVVADDSAVRSGDGSYHWLDHHRRVLDSADVPRRRGYRRGRLYAAGQLPDRRLFHPA